jgi:hypothetical protein
MIWSKQEIDNGVALPDLSIVFTSLVSVALVRVCVSGFLLSRVCMVVHAVS